MEIVSVSSVTAILDFAEFIGVNVEDQRRERLRQACDTVEHVLKEKSLSSATAEPLLLELADTRADKPSVTSRSDALVGPLPSAFRVTGTSSQDLTSLIDTQWIFDRSPTGRR